MAFSKPPCQNHPDRIHLVPGCGRTMFNIQEAVRKVKAGTSHLTGLKIAVMGCIVNGPEKWPMLIMAMSARDPESAYL